MAGLDKERKKMCKRHVDPVFVVFSLFSERVKNVRRVRV